MSSDVEVLAEALHKTLLGCTNDCFDHEGRRTHGSWGTDAAEGVLAALPAGWHLTTEATDTEGLQPRSTNPFLDDVAAEIVKARAKHANMNSLHEAYAVIHKELDEFWEEVRAWRGSKGDTDRVNARRELVQIAAMAMRAAEDLLDER